MMSMISFEPLSSQHADSRGQKPVRVCYLYACCVKLLQQVSDGTTSYPHTGQTVLMLAVTLLPPDLLLLLLLLLLSFLLLNIHLV